MKKALVCDWLQNFGGSEKCLESFTSIWNDFEIFSLVDYLSKDDREAIVKGKRINTSFIQNLPFANKIFRNYLPLFPLAIESFDLHKFDLVISSSHSVAKNILTNSNQLHISYVHTPMRYAWDLHFNYLNQFSRQNVKSQLAKYFLHRIRIWDSCSSNRPDYYIANSINVSKRIKKIYNKESVVIYPPVDVDKFTLCEIKDDYYVTVGRLVPYKKVEMIVEAFKIFNKKLIIIGIGPELSMLKKNASKNIEFLEFQSNEVVVDIVQKAKAFVFAANEDFGIAPIEAQACGTPVICFGAGGSLETVIDGTTGVYFMRQTAESLLDALHFFESNSDTFHPSEIRKSILRFNRNRFEQEFKDFVDDRYEQFANK